MKDLCSVDANALVGRGPVVPSPSGALPHLARGAILVARRRVARGSER
jgi:hypothetical protein